MKNKLLILVYSMLTYSVFSQGVINCYATFSNRPPQCGIFYIIDCGYGCSFCLTSERVDNATYHWIIKDPNGNTVTFTTPDPGRIPAGLQGEYTISFVKTITNPITKEVIIEKSSATYKSNCNQCVDNIINITTIDHNPNLCEDYLPVPQYFGNDQSNTSENRYCICPLKLSVLGGQTPSLWTITSIDNRNNTEVATITSSSSSPIICFGNCNRSWITDIKVMTDLVTCNGSYLTKTFSVNSQTCFYSFTGIDTSVSSSIMGRYNLKKQLNVFPNPVNEVLHLSFDEAKEHKLYSIRIVDAIGRVVIAINTENNSEEIATHYYNKGMYFYIVESDNAIITKGKFVIEK